MRIIERRSEMTHMTKWLAAVAFLVTAMVWTTTADAKATVRVFEATELANGSLVATDQCCGQRCITYRTHKTLKKTCCGCCESVETILLVQDPCTCCFVEVPVCVPACCIGEIDVCNGKGLFGRSTVTHEWCCGYKVKVVFDRRGDVTVHTYGK